MLSTITPCVDVGWGLWRQTSAIASSIDPWPGGPQHNCEAQGVPRCRPGETRRGVLVCAARPGASRCMLQVRVVRFVFFECPSRRSYRYSVEGQSSTAYIRIFLLANGLIHSLKYMRTDIAGTGGS